MKQGATVFALMFAHGVQGKFAPHILADGDELHFGRD